MEGGDHNQGWHEPVRKTKAETTKKGLGSSLWRKNKNEGRCRLSAGEEDIILREKREGGTSPTSSLPLSCPPKKRIFKMGPAEAAQVGKGQAGTPNHLSSLS